MNDVIWCFKVVYNANLWTLFICTTCVIYDATAIRMFKIFLINGNVTSSGTDLISLLILFLLGQHFKKAYGCVLSNRIRVKIGGIVCRISDMTSYFQDGGHVVISCRKVLSPGEWTESICSIWQFLIYSTFTFVRFLVSVFFVYEAVVISCCLVSCVDIVVALCQLSLLATTIAVHLCLVKLPPYLLFKWSASAVKCYNVFLLVEESDVHGSQFFAANFSKFCGRFSWQIFHIW